MAALALTVALSSPFHPQVVPPPCAEGLIHQAPYCTAPAPEIPYLYGPAVDQWRPWIAIYFKTQDINHALKIIACESAGDPNALGGVGEVGLFQHHPGYWAERSARYGWGGWSAWSVDANVAVAAAMVYYDSRSWQHWSCER